MKVEVFTVCDYAKAETSGKLYVIGVFDHIFAKEAPAPLPPSAIAVRLRFDEFEQGAHQAKLTFVDSDGARIIPEIGLQMNVQIPPGESTATANVVVVLPQMHLPRFGDYAVDLMFDTKVEATAPLYVRAVPTAAGPPTPRS
jgi:hypothetical protein